MNPNMSRCAVDTPVFSLQSLGRDPLQHLDDQTISGTVEPSIGVVAVITPLSMGDDRWTAQCSYQLHVADKSLLEDDGVRDVASRLYATATANLDQESFMWCTYDLLSRANDNQSRFGSQRTVRWLIVEPGIAATLTEMARPSVFSVQAEKSDGWLQLTSLCREADLPDTRFNTMQVCLYTDKESNFGETLPEAAI